MASSDSYGGADPFRDPYAQQQTDPTVDPYATPAPKVTTGATTQPASAVASPTPAAGTNPYAGQPGQIQAVWPSNAGPAPAGYTQNPSTGNSALLGTPPPAAAPGAAPDWVGAALSKAQSTDDPAYWAQQIAADNGAHSQAYWEDRIARGDGALAVRNGTLQPVGNSSLLGGSADNAINSSMNPQLQQLLSQQLAQQQSDAAAKAQFNSQFRNAILQQLGVLTNSSSATDPNGPELSPILQAYNAQSQRGLTNTRNLLAEQAYANGTLNSGGADTRAQQASEAASGAQANFTGQQVSQAVTARQQQLQHLLDMGAGFLTASDTQAIQTELAQLNAQQQNAQLRLAGTTADNNLGYNYTSLGASSNRDALLAALGY